MTPPENPLDRVHITADAQQATELGLTPAGRHAWRVQVPKDELEMVTEETRRISRPG